jgi:hypothetical protein
VKIDAIKISYLGVGKIKQKGAQAGKRLYHKKSGVAAEVCILTFSLKIT